jgi:hypothetical protein
VDGEGLHAVLSSMRHQRPNALRLCCRLHGATPPTEKDGGDDGVHVADAIKFWMHSFDPRGPLTMEVPQQRRAVDVTFLVEAADSSDRSILGDHTARLLKEQQFHVTLEPLPVVAKAIESFLASTECDG